MAAHQDDRRRQAWSAYWSSGRLHSCAGGHGGNYAGAIGGFWRDLFARSVAGERWLDLATGNGPLPQLLWQTRRGEIAVDAVDLADLAPDWYRPEMHAGVRFHPRTRMEALPFADATFDGVASQFGFEYAPRAQALDEALRVAGPGATFALVMHHAGSVLVQVGREELAHHELLQGADGLLAAACAVMPAMAAVRGGAEPGQAAAEARKRYNAAMAALADAAGASRAPDLLLESRDQVHWLVTRVGSGALAAPVALSGLQAYADALDGARLRTAEMVAHALAREDVDDLVGRLRLARPALQVEITELRQAEGVLGWSLLARPASTEGG